MNADVSVYGADGKLAASHGFPIGLAASERERFGRMPRIMRIDLPTGASCWRGGARLVRGPACASSRSC